MALTRAKIVVLLCSVLAVVTFVIVQQTDILKVKPKPRSAVSKSPKAQLLGASNEQTSKRTSNLTVTPKVKLKGRSNTPKSEKTGILNKQTDAPKPKIRGVLITQKPEIKLLLNTPTAKITGFVTDKPKTKAKGISTNIPSLFRTSEANVKGDLNASKPKAMSIIRGNKESNNSDNDNNNKILEPNVTSVRNTSISKHSNINNSSKNNNYNSSSSSNSNMKALKPNVTNVPNISKPVVVMSTLRRNNNNNSSKNNNNSSSKNSKATKPKVTSVLKTPKPKVMSKHGNINNSSKNSSYSSSSSKSKSNKASKPEVKSDPNTLKPKVVSTLSNISNSNSRSKNIKTFKTNVTSMPNTSKTKMQKWYYSPKEKESKWKRCEKLISGKEKLSKTRNLWNDSEILAFYKPNKDCAHVLQARFGHPPVSKEEKQLPIAFGFTIYKGARLFERILQAIYMPNNVYCIHIDKKSPEVFRKSIQAIIRCLPNVFIAANSVDVVWGHFTVLQAQFNCMEELLKSSVRWKYYVSLVGQDFPLYDNKEIVRALLGLNNSNNIESEPMPRNHIYRTKVAFTLINGRIKKTNMTKPPPPHNISIRKGSTHIIAIREFVEFVLHSQTAKDFNEFLKDSFVPDETLYSSLQWHPHVPGGIHGNQPKWIPRALYWLLKKTRNICRGVWIRQLCWITLEDLRWALGEEKKEKLFVHKIPFNFNDELLECILVARQGRKYATAIWKQDKSAQS